MSHARIQLSCAQKYLSSANTDFWLILTHSWGWNVQTPSDLLKFFRGSILFAGERKVLGAWLVFLTRQKKEISFFYFYYTNIRVHFWKLQSHIVTRHIGTHDTHGYTLCNNSLHGILHFTYLPQISCFFFTDVNVRICMYSLVCFYWFNIHGRVLVRTNWSDFKLCIKQIAGTRNGWMVF